MLTLPGMNGIHSLMHPSDRLRGLNVLILAGWGVGLTVFPGTLANPAYAGMAYLPPLAWAALFLQAAVLLAVTPTGKPRALASGLSTVLWGTLALCMLYTLLTSGPGVGSLPAVILYATLALSSTLCALDGAK